MADETPEPKSGFKTVLVFSMLFAVLGAVVVFAYFATFRRPVTTVILIRHAEKVIDPNNPDPDLSPAGQARAQELVRMFGDAGINAIYATQYKRTQQTVKAAGRQIGFAGQSSQFKEHGGSGGPDSFAEFWPGRFHRGPQQHRAGNHRRAGRPNLSDHSRN